MDPHPLPDIEETSTTDLARVTISAKDASATGLSAFDPRSVTVIDNNVAFELAFPAIGISADYSLTGSILGFPITGAKGAADATFMDISAFCTASLNVTDSGVKTHFLVGSRYLMLQRFPPIDEVIKMVLKDLADGAFEKYEPVLEADLSELLTKGLNAALALRGGVEGKAFALDLPEVRVYEAGNANGFLDHMI